ncbi:MAG: heme-degrading monooxygenase HmoA [Myxococcota bacterium]|jgi:heme-degrading monooxygenase HmoA
MIARVWHGWTTPADANRYEELLTGTVLPDIAALGMSGYLGADLMRQLPKTDATEVEFLTVLWFESLPDVKALTGDDFEVAHVPPDARALLLRFDARSRHYDHIRGREAD